MKNPSGINPTEFKVLIEPKKTDDVSKGGIIIPDETKDRQQYAATEGTLIALSPLAFTYAGPSEWNGEAKPKTGDRVVYAKYAGAVIRGKDGKEYRLCNDKDVCAVLE